MPTILRFVDDVGAVRLDLNTDTGFVLAKGLDLGEPPLEQVWLHQTPYDGAVLASSRQDVTVMTIPVILRKQASWVAMQTLMTSLKTELARASNIIEYRPLGAGTSFLIDTYRSPTPSLFRGQAAPTAALDLQDSEPMPLTIYRHPVMRGAGAHI